MVKYKICPYCGMRNDPAVLECEACETDISTAHVVDDEMVRMEEEKSHQKVSPSTVTAVRICEGCGFHNPSNVRKCQSCGEDISDVMPVNEENELRVHLILSSLDGEYAYPLQTGKTLIGREAAMSEYLSQKNYVSRRHAQIVFENGIASIENLSETNYTYINNKKIDQSVLELHDGDILGLGGNEQNGKRQDQAAYFMVRLGICI